MDRYDTLLGLIGYLLIGTAAVLIPSAMPAITAEFAPDGMPMVN
jgi:hypothetical protein